jgi:hypothetical protein
LTAILGGSNDKSIQDGHGMNCAGDSAKTGTENTTEKRKIFNDREWHETGSTGAIEKKYVSRDSHSLKCTAGLAASVTERKGSNARNRIQCR